MDLFSYVGELEVGSKSAGEQQRRPRRDTRKLLGEPTTSRLIALCSTGLGDLADLSDEI